MIENIFVCGDIVSKTQPIVIDTHIQELIKKSKISICNLEAPITHIEQTAEIKAGPNMLNYGNVIKDLSNFGFNLFCLANNHIFDYGALGLKTTMDEIKKNNRNHIGATLTANISDCLFTCEAGGAKIAILNGGENQFGTFNATKRYEGKQEGYFHCFDSVFFRTLQNTKQSNQFDFIICIIHAGLENASVPLPQFRELYRCLCDLGADMIIGHHPHWAQGYERYRDKYIFYSLGNFCFNLDKKQQERENDSYSLLLSFENRNFVGFKPIFHQFNQKSKMVTRMQEEELSFSLAELNKQLELPQYKQEVDRIISSTYPIYQEYYNDIFNLCSKQQSLWKNFKKIIKKIVKQRRGKYSDALLLHNISIETHRFIQELALDGKLETNK